MNTLPPPPPGPPCRSVVSGFFGDRETKKSIRAREDYHVFMAGYMFALNKEHNK